MKRASSETGAARNAAGALFALLFAASPSAGASFLSGDALGTMADVISWVVLVAVPVGAIALFWMVHVLPEKIAEKRHHPQQEAIKTLCLLSLVFGGLLWPIAWLWAYTRPVSYRLAYGTDKHEDYYLHMAERAGRGELDPEALEHLEAEFTAMAARGALPEKLHGLRAVVAQARPAAPVASPPPAAAGGSD